MNSLRSPLAATISLALASVISQFAVLPAAAQAPLIQAAEIRALTREQAAEARPVRVRGVVNWMPNPTARSFFFADDSAGISVIVERNETEPAKVIQSDGAVSQEGLASEMEVEVVGVTSPGGYAPVIFATEVRILGQRPLSPAKKVSLAHLQGGGEDSQRVQLEPVVVQSVVGQQAKLGDRVLRVCSSSGSYALVTVRPAPWNEPERVVDAEVRVTGIVLTLFNSRLELTGIRLDVGREEDFEVVKPPPTDPFAAPRAEIGGLRRFRPGGVSPHRLTVDGTVTLIESNGLVIQDRGRGVEVRTDPPGDLRIGDRVRVAGFVEEHRAVAFLTGGLVQKIATGAPLDALATTAEEILGLSAVHLWRRWEEFPEDLDHRLVRLEGTLIGNAAAGASAFSVQTGTGQVLKVQFADGSPGFMQPPATGSLLALTGVALVRHEPGPILPEFIQPAAVELLLRGADDVQVLRAPPWWNTTRLLIALALAALVIVLATVWVLLLGRTVRKQAARIEETLRAHRDAELAHEAAKRERLRLAGDLHDGVHQLLTATAYRLKSVEQQTASDPAAALAELDRARKILGRSQHELRSLMWGIHELATAQADFAELLAQALSHMDHWPIDTVFVHSHGTPQPVAAQVAGSLLLLSQEAVENALRHGEAGRVDFTVDYTEEELRLTIQDNGCGFDPVGTQPTPESGLGLGNMRRRVTDLSGVFTLTSSPGEGTILLVELPWKALHKLASRPSAAPAAL